MPDPPDRRVEPVAPAARCRLHGRECRYRATFFHENPVQAGPDNPKGVLLATLCPPLQAEWVVLLVVMAA